MASAEPIAVALGGGEGDEQPRIEWDAERLRALATNGEGEPGWRLDGEIDWASTDAVRVVSAAFEDGGVLALAALRPAGAAGHDAETVRAVLVEGDGEVVELEWALISTEYDRAGEVARIGLELYTDAEERPLRASAKRVEVEDAPAPPAEPGREATRLSFRMEGRRGSGMLELLSAG
jgi:hypothetical protein